MRVDVGSLRVAGREFKAEQLCEIAGVVRQGAGLSRRQLTLEVCARTDWRRPSGAPKTRECRDLLERMESAGWFRLPAKRGGRPVGARTSVPYTLLGEPRVPLMGTVNEFGTVSLEPVGVRADHLWFRELLGRHHYRGYRVPYGAHVRYLAFVSQPERMVVGAVQVSSAAWRLAVRDRWIGWDEPTRERNLQRVVNNSRFLILPWVRVRNLASRLLAELAGRLAGDWAARFGVEPLLVETMVECARFRGTCYRAANWVELGETAGRGRMDRHKRCALAKKRVLVYPLVPEAVRGLREA